jgi:uncharacterized protein (DUF58 family)
VSALPGADSHTLGLRTLYILPTRHGLLYAVILSVTLVAGVNYGNGLAYGLTFLLAGVGIVAMLRTHRNLHGLTVAPGAAPSVHAGEVASFTVRLANAEGPERWAVALEVGGSAVRARVPAGAEVAVEVPVRSTRRGWLPLPGVSVRTRFPLGLWQVWSRRLALRQRCLIYPHPAPPELLLRFSDRAAEDGTNRGDGDDFAGLREYRRGDAPQHIAWKAVARGEGWYTKEFGGSGAINWIDWDSFPGLDPETRLSVLCRLVLDAEQQGLTYGLRLPSGTFGPGRGEMHRARCLRSLALFPETS